MSPKEGVGGVPIRNLSNVSGGETRIEIKMTRKCD